MAMLVDGVAGLLNYIDGITATNPKAEIALFGGELQANVC
jgi:hypothetical protein